MEKVLKTEFNLKENIKNLIKPYCIKGACKGIDVWLYFQPSVDEVVVGDAVGLNQVIVNLVESAIKCTDKGYVLLLVRQIESCNLKTKLQFAVYDTENCKEVTAEFDKM